jgi:hypothetical protein
MTSPPSVTIRVHSAVKDCAFCRAEAIGSQQQLERVVQEVQERNEADCCSFHGQAVAGLAQQSGRAVDWVVIDPEGTGDGMPES